MNTMGERLLGDLYQDLERARPVVLGHPAITLRLFINISQVWSWYVGVISVVHHTCHKLRR